MPETDFTLIDGERVVETTARIESDAVVLSPEALRTATGFSLELNGLCRGDICVPLGVHTGRIRTEGVDLAAFAELPDRSIAIDTGEAAAALGDSATRRASQLASLEAPDFSLPDLAGKLHALSDHRGRKVLIVAWASW